MTEEMIDWLNSSTEEERKLADKAMEFEDVYFTDMTLADYEEELSSHEVMHKGEWKKSTFDLVEPGELSLDNWMFCIGNIELDPDAVGICFLDKRTIKVVEEDKDNDHTLLHEMIHAYEYMLSEYVYDQYLIIRLTHKLLQSTPNLIELLNSDIHLLNIEHSPLFMLKSLDLDLRLNLPLGTIYSYGRTELFKNDD